MPKGVKIRIKKQKIGGSKYFDNTAVEEFGNLFNIDRDKPLDTDILFNKFSDLLVELRRFRMFLKDGLLNGSLFKFLKKQTTFNVNITMVLDFIEQLDSEIKKDVPLNIFKSPSIKAEEQKRYYTLKDSKVVESILSVCHNLINHRSNLEKTKNIYFVNDIPSEFIALAPITNIDFKALWADEFFSEKLKKVSLLMMKILLQKSYAIYKIVSTPDIDVKKFTETITGSILTLKRRIRGCDDAFNEIARSVNLFEDNFSNYYRDFVGTEQSNPSVMIDNFVRDIINKHEGKKQKRLIMQFGRIVRYIKQQYQKNRAMMPAKKRQVSDTLFDSLEGKMSIIDGISEREQILTKAELAESRKAAEEKK